jgi:hypothetical protein
LQRPSLRHQETQPEKVPSEEQEDISQDVIALDDLESVIATSDSSSQQLPSLPPDQEDLNRSLLPGQGHEALREIGRDLPLSQGSSEEPIAAEAFSSSSIPQDPYTAIPTSAAGDGLSTFLTSLTATQYSNTALFRQQQTSLYTEFITKFYQVTCSCNAHLDSTSYTAGSTLRDIQARFDQVLPSPVQYLGSQFNLKSFSGGKEWLGKTQNQNLRLSLQETEHRLPQPHPHRSTPRVWDIDSLWIGATSLAAIGNLLTFRLSFIPSYNRNIHREQIIRPHRLDLARTRHMLLGSFSTNDISFSVLIFFPESNIQANRSSHNQPNSEHNFISHQRQEELYDRIILPAARDTVPPTHLQELPTSFQAAYAKSNTQKETPMHNPDGVTRLQYIIPSSCLFAFWQSIVQYAEQVTIEAANAPNGFHYFRKPQLLFQSHDLKNSILDPSPSAAFELLGKKVLAYLDPQHIDLTSTWADLGVRYMPSLSPGLAGKPKTFLWKTECLRNLHNTVKGIGDTLLLQPDFYQSFLLKEVGTYTGKARTSRRHNHPGSPDAQDPGLIRIKAYNSNKDIFAAMFSDYQLFAAEQLPLLALSEHMLRTLTVTSKTSTATHAKILGTWVQGKKHVQSLAQSKAFYSYGVRKEATFRFDCLLTMWDNNQLCDPIVEDPMHTNGSHSAYLQVHTKDINSFIFSQALRFIIPLDFIFENTALNTATLSPARQLLALRSAIFFQQLLIYSLTSERVNQSHHNWLWLKRWTVKDRKHRNRKVERRGLGLSSIIDNYGMLWLPDNLVSWDTGFLQIRALRNIYISNTPHQNRILNTDSSTKAATQSIQPAVQFAIMITKITDQARTLQERLDAQDEAMIFAARQISYLYQQYMLEQLLLLVNKPDDKLHLVEKPLKLARAERDKQKEAQYIMDAYTLTEIYYLIAKQCNPSSGSSLSSYSPLFKASRRKINNWHELLIMELLFNPKKPNEYKKSIENKPYATLYENLRSIWEKCMASADVPDQISIHFRTAITPFLGTFIQVIFISENFKPMTYSPYKNGSSEVPQFFRVEYLAPSYNIPPGVSILYESPFTRDGNIQEIYHYDRYSYQKYGNPAAAAQYLDLFLQSLANNETTISIDLILELSLLFGFAYQILGDENHVQWSAIDFIDLTPQRIAYDFRRGRYCLTTSHGGTTSILPSRLLIHSIIKACEKQSNHECSQHTFSRIAKSLKKTFEEALSDSSLEIGFPHSLEQTSSSFETYQDQEILEYFRTGSQVQFEDPDGDDSDFSAGRVINDEVEEEEFEEEEGESEDIEEYL